MGEPNGLPDIWLVIHLATNLTTIQQKKDEVKVEVEDNRVLQISEEKNVEKEDKHDKWHRVVRSRGKFLKDFSFRRMQRSIRLRLPWRMQF
ncbi:unnamed protein product [Malus baccata var. baccata]